MQAHDVQDAGEVLKIEEAHGIITGSSLGQVGISDLREYACRDVRDGIPIYHPLIGL